MNAKKLTSTPTRLWKPQNMNDKHVTSYVWCALQNTTMEWISWVDVQVWVMMKYEPKLYEMKNGTHLEISMKIKLQCKLLA